MKLLLICVLLAAFDNDKIVRGETCTPNSMPYLASLCTDSSICGAALIHNKWVASAAHCRIPGIRIRLGKSTLSCSNDGTGTEPSINVAKVITHEQYNPITLENDIMLLKLSSPVTFINNVKPIGLPSGCAKAGTSCLISGWGKTKSGGSNDNNLLQCAMAPIMSDVDCSGSHPGKITANMSCIGYPQGENDSCQDISGGFVICGGEMQGIVSRGYDCAHPDKPVVFTSVCRYISWIIKTIAAN